MRGEDFLKKFSVIILMLFAVSALIMPSLTISAFSDDYSIIMVDDNSNELSIPNNIGIEIPKTEESVPIFGIIMWALVAVIIMAALIIIFANIGGAGSIDKSVRRERYKKKPIKKSKYSKYKE